MSISAVPHLPPAISAPQPTSSSPATFPFAHAVPAGSFLSVAILDGFGYNATPTSITDTKGNAYTLDAIVNQADGDGSVYLASAEITNALTIGDTLTLAWSGGSWGQFHLVAVAFTAPSLVADVFQSHGTHLSGAPGDIDVFVTPTADALLIAYGAYQDPTVANDPAWTALMGNSGEASNYFAGAYKVVAAGTPASYHSSTSNDDAGSGYSAATACAYVLGGGGGGGGGGGVGGLPPGSGVVETGIVAR